MRNYDFVIPVSIFGDQNAIESTYDFWGQQVSYPGLPVNDITLLRAMEFQQKKVQMSFWCNSYPLMGAEPFVDDESLFEKPIEMRWIPYHKMPGKRGFYNKEFWKNLSERQMSLIVQNYFDMNEHLHYEFGNKLVLLPIAAYIFDRVLDLNLEIYNRLLEYDWRKVDLSPLDNLTNEQAFTEKNTLTEPAYRLIEPKIKEWIV